MSGSNYAVLIVAQAAISLFAFLMGRYVLKVSTPTALAAVALFNSVPLPNPLGVKTPIYLHDLLAPAIFFVLLARGTRRAGRLGWLAASSALLWPLVGTILGTLETAGMSDWVEFLVRRLGFVLFFVAGLQGRARSIQVGRLLDVGLLVWIPMVAVGVLQYAGVVDTDVGSWASEDATRVSILESASAMRGFMGMNRGAVGVWGAAMVAYAVASLSEQPRPRRLLVAVYYAGIAASLVAILGSGSRTGVVGAIAAVVYVFGRRLLQRRRGSLTRLVALGMTLVVCGVAVSSYLDLEAPAARFAFESRSLNTGEQRARIQGKSLGYVFSNARPLLLGMGPSTELFVRAVGWELRVAHPHSEYIDVLWQAGLPGFLMYLAFLALLFREMRQGRGEQASPVGAVGQAMLIAGMVTGLAVGNIFTWSARLATFGLLMAFVYGRILFEVRSTACSQPVGATGSPRWRVQ